MSRTKGRFWITRRDRYRRHMKRIDPLWGYRTQIRDAKRWAMAPEVEPEFFERFLELRIFTSAARKERYERDY